MFINLIDTSKSSNFLLKNCGIFAVLQNDTINTMSDTLTVRLYFNTTHVTATKLASSFKTPSMFLVY